MKKGLLITFEGGEGAGKSSHIATVTTTLEARGHDVVVVREPGATLVGEAIRNILLSRENESMTPRAELLLYEAARAQIVDEVIAPALDSGCIVLADRFYDSTTAYQGYGRGLDKEMIDALNMTATGGLVPDLTIWLDVPVRDGLERASRKGAPDRLESEALAFHEAVHSGFAAIAKSEPQRVHRVDATRPKADVSCEIAAIVLEVLARVE
jgi:dTMP kinase